MKYSLRDSAAIEKRHSKRLVIVIAAIIFGAFFVVYGAKSFYERSLLPPDAESGRYQTLSIDKGASLDQIAVQLKDAGLIRSVWAFKLYTSGQKVPQSLKAGTYSLSPSQSVAQIVAQLTHGKVAVDLVTIVPGTDLSQIRQTFIDNGFSTSAVDKALDINNYRGHKALEDVPNGASLEGYLYPDSYHKDSNTKPEDIVKQALDEMQDRLTPNVLQGFADQGLSSYEAVILASVVEREVSSDQDRQQAAQVFIRRLNSDIALQSDATKPKFNSYQVPGLPPQPISNMTLSSLSAVASPADTNWLYFVSGDDGVTHFSSTLAEHEANIAKYCHELCGR